MVIHTRIGKIGNCANKKRKKTAGIKLKSSMIGKFVVIISRGEYRKLYNSVGKLKRMLSKINKISNQKEFS